MYIHIPNDTPEHSVFRTTAAFLAAILNIHTTAQVRARSATRNSGLRTPKTRTYIVYFKRCRLKN